MLAATMNYRNLFDPMDLRRIIPSDITASAIAHLSLLTLFLLFSDVHPFGVVTAEQIPVEIVTPQEIAEKQVPAEPPVVEKTPEPVPAPTPQPDFPAPDKPAAASAPPPLPTAAQPQKQAALAAPPAAQPQAAAPPQPQQTAAPAYKPPEPDLSVKYQVLLGLPPELPPATPQARDKAVDNFDAPATEAADIAKGLVGEFRRHLKTCLKLPASLASGDDVKVKLRVLMTPEGRLAADPVLIEASASMKGPLLMRGAISALQACQPYAMLPVDRYGEWKVLDLSFTPRDF